MQVPANRIGYPALDLGQLKILQEIITLSVFVPFALFYMRQPLKLDFLWAGLCLLGAAYFISAPSRPESTEPIVPVLSRWFIRTALIALVAGFGLAFLTAVRGGASPLAPTVLHLLVVGWLSQMVFGVAYWLFPTLSSAAPRGREWLGWLCYLALNAGLVLRITAEPVSAAGVAKTVALVGSAGLQLTAAIAFVVNTWPRVRTRN